MAITPRAGSVLGKYRVARLSCAGIAILVATVLATPSAIGADSSRGGGGIMAGPGQRIGEPVSPGVSSGLDQPAGQNDGSGITNAVTYVNWSGYAATASLPFNEAETTFVQPSVTCTVPGAWTVFWVGFDGFENSTVEQAGTAAQCGSGSKPQPSYYAWWEMYPTNGIGDMTRVTVKPGDTIHAAVTYTASDATYALTVADLTDKQEYTQLTTCAPNLTCARASAEWIVERPATNGVYTPLADWSTMKIESSEASNTTKTVITGEGRHKVAAVTNVLQPASAFSSTAINMGNDPYTGETLASVGRLDRTGTTFTDTWQAAQ
jgi:hypothetical protein